MATRRLSILAPVVAVALIATGMGIGWAITVFSTPATLLEPAPVTMAPVRSQQFADPRSVELDLTRAPDQHLLTQRPGMLTASDCRVGSPIVSGSATIAVDGRPLLDLHLTTPLWRSLSVGIRGADAEAVNNELSRLGRPASGNTVTTTTMRHLNELRAAAGLPTSTTISPADIVWLPTPTAVPASCTAIGTTLAPGDQLAGLPAALSAARWTPPADAVPGVRIAIVDGERLALAEDGTLADAELTVLMQTPSYRGLAADREQAQSGLPARVELAEPIEVSLLPAAAIGQVNGQDACIVTPDGNSKVRIVGSELGRTFVTTEGPAPTEVSIDPEKVRSCT